MASLFTHPDPIFRSLASAISSARARLRDPRSSVEGIAISRKEIAQYTARLADMGIPA